MAASSKSQHRPLLICTNPLKDFSAQNKAHLFAGGRGVSQAGGSQGQVLSDEELARQLQRQLDMEDSLQQDQYFVQQPRCAPLLGIRAACSNVLHK